MGEIISIHSFRGGTGKSNLAANLAAIIARKGHRVGVVDTDVQSPGVHVLFGFDESRLDKALNDYLFGRASIEEIAYPMGETDDPVRPYLKDLKLWLIPSSIRTDEIARILNDGYEVERLNTGLHALVRKLQLDYLLIDTHPGLNEETLLSIAISRTLIIVLRPDQQDLQGTAVTVDIARKLEVPRMLLVVNKVPARYDLNQVKHDIEINFNAPVVGVLPLSDDVASNASNAAFALLQPQHVWSQTVHGIAESILDPKTVNA